MLPGAGETSSAALTCCARLAREKFVVLVTTTMPGVIRAGPAAGTLARPAAAGSAKSAGRANVPAAGPARITPGMVVVTSTANFSRARLAQQVRAALLVSPAPGSTRAATAQLRGCVLGLIGDHPPQRVESVRFEGKPATLVVARTGATDTAWIAAQDCSATNRHVLDTASLPSGISGP